MRQTFPGPVPFGYLRFFGYELSMELIWGKLIVGD